MWPCFRPARAVLPTWEARVLPLSGPLTFSSFVTSRKTSRIQSIILKRSRGLKVYSFKGNTQAHDGPQDGHISSKRTASLSCSQQEKDAAVGSASSMKNQVSLSPERKEETIAGSRAVENIFKRWLILLRSQRQSSVEEQIPKEEPGQQQSSESISGKREGLVGNLLKAVILRIWALDATVKFPLLIFPPFYLAVTLIHGAEIAQELTPLWVIGPVVLSAYIGIIRGVCFLYSFWFSLPTYFIRPVSFIIKGELNAYIRQKFWYPIKAIKDVDYKELYQQKYKHFMETMNEKWLDYVESIWPRYCKTVRFLKRCGLL